MSVVGECVPWDGLVMSTGYGLAYVPSSGYGRGDFRTVLAHRLAWEREFGPLPRGAHVHHRCETRLCVNVEHMKLLTVRNHAGGLGHGKLTQADADDIRRRRRAGERGVDVAPLYDISVQQVCNIVKGRCWA